MKTRASTLLAAMSLLLLAIVLFVAGCGGGGGGSSPSVAAPPPPPPAPTYPSVAGQWTMNAVSSNGHGNSIVLTNLVNQGEGSFYGQQTVICNYVSTIVCEGNLIGNTGTITTKGTVTPAGVLAINVAITNTGSTINPTPCALNVTGTITGSSMNGEYTGCNDAGTFTGTMNPSVTGSYTGTLTSLDNGMTFGVSASIIETTSTFVVTGTAAVTGSPCFTSLTFGPPSQAVGEGVLLVDAVHGMTAIAVPGAPGPNVAYVVTATPYCQADEGSGALLELLPAE